jgi:hypothetical protein
MLFIELGELGPFILNLRAFLFLFMYNQHLMTIF